MSRGGFVLVEVMVNWARSKFATVDDVSRHGVDFELTKGRSMGVVWLYAILRDGGSVPTLGVVVLILVCSSEFRQKISELAPVYRCINSNTHQQHQG